MQEAHFGICALRRHVVQHLQQMHLMNVSIDDVPGQYSSQSNTNDHQIRHALVAQNIIDPQERQHYVANRQVSSSSANRSMRLNALIAERNWLREPPMDYRTFRHFCANPTHHQYEGREELVIELFPQADFFNPPEELSDPAIMGQEGVWSPATLQILSSRGQQAQGAVNPALFALDLKLGEQLCDLWTRALPGLPSHVTSVWIIAKSPNAPHLGPWPNNLPHGWLPAVANASRAIPGRGVLKGILIAGSTLP